MTPAPGLYKGQSFYGQSEQSCLPKGVKVERPFHLPGEHFTAAMTERQADSLLRADLMKRLMIFKDYGKDALLLAVLSYNVGAGRLLGYGKHPKSRLLRKIESGDRNFYREFVSFCRYKGKVLRGLVKRRKVEFALFYIP